MLDSSTCPRGLSILLRTSYVNLVYQVYKQGLKSSYETFTISKKNGESRTINAPNEQLKNLQLRLKGILDELYKPHIAASAFVKGRGIVFNAKKHTKKSVVFNVDLKDFFGSINFGRVRGLLIAKPYELREDTATLIANICCLNNTLPQGAPTSPTISNMIARKLDRELSRLAKEDRAYYSRYADDITFSFRSEEKNNIYVVDNGAPFPSADLEKIINGNGFSVNSSKTRINLSNERQSVTGLTVNKKVNIDRRYIRTTRAILHSVAVDRDSANEKYLQKMGLEKGAVESMVLGRINYIGMVKGIESPVYQTLARKFNNLGNSLSAPLEPKSGKHDLSKRLIFDTRDSREYLEHTVWVVEFENVEGLDVDCQLIQGTAFMVQQGKLLTCAHTFDKAGSPDHCFVYRINDVSKKYRANLIEVNIQADLAVLELDDDEDINFPMLEMASDFDKHVGYQVSVVGFPQLQRGHRSVSVLPASIVNSFIKNAEIQFFEIDHAIHGGCSGGPVIDAYMKVVGVAALGVTVVTEGGVSELAGNNAFISAKHIFDKLSIFSSNSP